MNHTFFLWLVTFNYIKKNSPKNRTVHTLTRDILTDCTSGLSFTLHFSVTLQFISGLGRTVFRFLAHTHAEGPSGRVISPSQRLLPKQHNKHNRRAYMNSAGFEPAVPEIELASYLCLKPHDHWDRPCAYCIISAGKYGKPGWKFLQIL